MDINCPKCGEAWDMDELHDIAEENDTDFNFERKQFFEYGCGRVFNNKDCKLSLNPKALASQALYDILGDDIDGIASSMDDMNW
jgi:hypothetical protein